MADGVIRKVARLRPSGILVCFTASLMAQGYEDDPFRRLKLIEKGVELLKKRTRKIHHT